MRRTTTPSLFSDTRGAAMIEYGLLLAVLSLGILAATSGMAGQVLAIWHQVSDGASSAMAGAG